ncbi:MAG TPA: LptA/OstA family protein, partial [Acidobacteriaceae bacterium]
VDASGAVALKQGTRTITAPRLTAAMNAQSQMQRAQLSGGVGLLDTSAERPMHGSAKTVTIACDNAGRPTTAVMEGAVSLSMQDRRPGAEAPTGLTRQMGADRVTLTMARVNRGIKISAVHAEGKAWVRGDAVMRPAGGKASGLKTTTVAADDLRLALTADAHGKQQPEILNGTGHTQITQRMPDATVETSTGDALQAHFAQPSGQGLEIASAIQTGNVQMRSAPGIAGEQPSAGIAQQASLDGANDVVTLSGRPRLTRGDTSVIADSIRITQQTGDAVANGNVAATFANANAKPGAPVTHALAADAVLRRAAQTVEFHGTDAAPARLWQGASQVEAANLLLNHAKNSMQAWPATPHGEVRTVFANASTATAAAATPRTQKGVRPPSGDNAVQVISARLDYSGAAHQAVFSGGVAVQGQDGTVHAQRGVAFLTPKQGSAPAGNPGKPQPDPVAASLDKVVMSGAVKVEQPGRTATGDQLLYTAATGEFVLTGTPGHSPHVIDEKQGSISGATLLFRSPDSTIVVAGEPASRRVHTETTMKK